MSNLLSTKFCKKASWTLSLVELVSVCEHKQSGLQYVAPYKQQTTYYKHKLMVPSNPYS